MKIQTKTTLWFTLITVAILSILSGTVYYFENSFVHNDFFKRLELRARLASRLKFEADRNTLESIREIKHALLESLPDEDSFFIQVNQSGEPIAPPPPGIRKSFLRNIFEAKGQTVFDEKGSTHYAGLFYRDESGDYLVIHSATNRFGQDIMARVRNILIIAWIASLVIIYSIGRYFSNKAFQPVRTIIQKVNAISEENLHLRLEKPAGADEIGELVNTFNQMLDRLSAAFEAQNNFISNASHELKTPLTAIVGETDYALSRQRSMEEYRQSLSSIGQQAEKLQRLTVGLLSLAQTSFDGKKQRWETIRMDELLIEVKENIDSIYPGNKVRIHFPDLPENEEGITMEGNPELLKMAIDNIVLNACKYSDNQEVTVRLEARDTELILTVSDRGIGIPPEEIEHIFDPFFRASNTVGYQGYGIGMPLTEKIIRLHKGKLTVDTVLRKGTRVTVFLPLKNHKRPA